ncbi:MAG: hypothetical protein MUP81_06275 [Dehalococcoidia bacterium]|nr:hypothetical protein [Dehalococcoidia bacterium]
MLTGEAKKNYQRDYMRKRRAALDVRPIEDKSLLDPIEKSNALKVLDQTLEQLHDYSCRLSQLKVVNDNISEVIETVKKKRQPIEAESQEVKSTLILETKICPVCGGKGYREFEAGLIRLACPECRGKS